jgi:hypothetical protein
MTISYLLGIFNPYFIMFALFDGSHAPALIVIHKSSQARKAVISAGMPKSRPWTVTSRLCKRLIHATYQALVTVC